MVKRRGTLRVLGILIAWLVAAPAFGQSDTSSLAGTVRDPDGGAIPGAVVDLRSHTTGAHRETVTDERGHYAFVLLAPGAYELTVQIPGFKRFRDSEVLLQVAQSAVLDARLDIGEVAESGRRFLQSGWASRVFGDLQVSGIYTMHSGFPFTVNVQSDTAGVGAGTGGIFVRPNRVPAVGQVAPSIVNGQYLNIAAFTMPPAFTFGNLGRNTVIGPGYVDLDAALAKGIKLGGRSTLQLRTEAFNLLSRRNYNLVGRIINDPSTFGKVLSQFDPRQLQFAIRWTF